MSEDFASVKLCDFGVTVALDKEGRAVEGAEYIGTEAWSPAEVIRGERVTSKADIFTLGMVVFEMLSLHSPHIDKLAMGEDGSDEEDEEAAEEAFRAALGTRPPLPDTLELDESYRLTSLPIFLNAPFCSFFLPFYHSLWPKIKNVKGQLNLDPIKMNSYDSPLKRYNRIESTLRWSTMTSTLDLF